jgi:hypothetical protein
MNRTGGLRSNSVRWLLFGFAALLALRAADAALVFQDRHTDSGGAQIVYSFGKGSGYANRYLNPEWNSPALPRGIEP